VVQLPILVYTLEHRILDLPISLVAVNLAVVRLAAVVAVLLVAVVAVVEVLDRLAADTAVDTKKRSTLQFPEECFFSCLCLA